MSCTLFAFMGFLFLMPFLCLCYAFVMPLLCLSYALVMRLFIVYLQHICNITKK